LAHHLTATGSFGFGKHKGKTVATVFGTEPSYLYWLQVSGYASLDAEIIEAVDAWKEAYPKEAKSVESSVARAGLAAASIKRDGTKATSPAQPTPLEPHPRVSKTLLTKPTTAATVKPPVEILICDEDDVLPPWSDELVNAFVTAAQKSSPRPIPPKDTEDPNWGTW